MSSSGAASNSKARKSLASTWPTREDSFNNPETPSKSLMGSSDASILFSPPGILKETLPDDSGFDSLNNHRMSVAGTSATDSPSSTSITSTSNQAATMVNAGRSPPKNKASCMMTLKFEDWWSRMSTYLQLDVRWNMIACGKTRPTLEMTEQARGFLSSMQPRSLDLWSFQYQWQKTTSCNWSWKVNFSREIKVVNSQIGQNRCQFTNYFSKMKKKKSRQNAPLRRIVILSSPFDTCIALENWRLTAHYRNELYVC